MSGPFGDHDWMTENLRERGGEHDGVQKKISRDQEDGEPDGLAEAAQENHSEDGQQQEREVHAVAHPEGDERVLEDMGGGVGGGERHRNDEVGGGEAEQDEDEELAFPFWEVALEHGDAALPVRALLRDGAVDGVGGEESHQNQNQ